MDAIAAFFTHNIVVVFFFYGLAFFSMGLAILVESRRASDLPLAQAMIPLAGFGIIHGLNEWYEMFQLLETAGATNIPAWMLSDEIRILHLVVSFALLSVFGIRLIYANHSRDDRQARIAAYAIVSVLVAVWFVALLLTRRIFSLEELSTADAADVLSRYILAVPGAILAGWAILLEQRTFRARGMHGFGRALLWAAIALFMYGFVLQMFPRPAPFFPANVLNSVAFNSVVGVPIQTFRALLAILTAVFIVRALRALELENRERLASATAAEAAARRQAEQLNADLRDAIENLASLYRLAGRVSATLDRDELLNEILPEFIQHESGLTASMVFWQDQPGPPTEPVTYTKCQTDLATQMIMFDRAVQIGRFVAESGTAAWWTDGGVTPIAKPEDLPENSSRESGTDHRTLGVPLSMLGAVVGSLVVCAKPELPAFTRRDFALVRSVGDQLSVALQNATLYAELQEREALRGELLHRAVAAQEKERQRIARELHDSTGQILTALGLGLAATAEQLERNPQLAARQLAEMRALCAQALDDLHHLLADLRPTVLDNLGLVAALRGQLHAVEKRSGIQTRLIVTGKRRLPSDMETTIFRIAQEAITNVIKHAGASRVEVAMTFETQRLLLQVSDNGVGFDVEAALHAPQHGRTAWGLYGMQERVTLAGGQMTVESARGGGTVITVDIPLAQLGEDTHEKDLASAG